MTRAAYDKGRVAATRYFKMGGVIAAAGTGGVSPSNTSTSTPAARTAMTPTTSAAAPVASGASKAQALG